MARRANIFRSKNLFSAIKIGGGYLYKYITGKPLIMNLNLNATNVCNQKCPMCNAVITGHPNAEFISYDAFRKYVDIFASHGVASLSISGGEPSVVPGMAKMIDYAAVKFPFGINLNTNLYASEKIVKEVCESALRNGVRIGISFDGFDEVADKLRGAKDVSKRIIENMKMVSEMKQKMGSSSRLNMHTVISDQNLHQIKRILDFSGEMGWTQTIAPINNFFYQEPVAPGTPLLHHSKELEDVIEYASKKSNISVSKDFLTNIPNFTLGKTPKLCPYLTGIFRTNKVFLEVNGDISLCSRKPIGNINKQSLTEIFSGEKYKKDVTAYEKCGGCWMVCFVEILLATPKFYQSRIIKQYKKFIA